MQTDGLLRTSDYATKYTALSGRRDAPTERPIHIRPSETLFSDGLEDRMKVKMRIYFSPILHPLQIVLRQRVGVFVAAFVFPVLQDAVGDVV